MPQWFNDPLVVAGIKLTGLFSGRQLSYEIIAEKYVIQHWICSTNERTVEVLVSVIKDAEDKHEIRVYELKPIASKNVIKSNE